MVENSFLIRGIICIIIGCVYLAMVLFYYYYLKTNEIADNTNYDKQKIYGPNIFLVLQIFVFVVSIVLYLFMSYTFYGKWKTSYKTNKHLHESCDNYQTLGEYIKSKIF